MANRDNDDDRNGHKNQKFNIDSKAFESEDDFDFESEDDAFINPSQKKNKGDSHLYVLTLYITMLMSGKSKPKDLSKHQVSVPHIYLLGNVPGTHATPTLHQSAVSYRDCLNWRLKQ